MQVLCNHLFKNQLSRRVEVAVWEKALQEALNDIGIAIFDYWFSQASGEEAKVLCAVAKAETPIFAKEVEELAKTGKLKVSARNVDKYLQRLLEKKLLTKSSRGPYFISDPMFRAYLCVR